MCKQYKLINGRKNVDFKEMLLNTNVKYIQNIFHIFIYLIMWLKIVIDNGFTVCSKYWKKINKR